MFGLCVNMLMQIDANDVVVLYMQISHATTPPAFVFWGHEVYVCGCSCLLVCLGVCVG